MNLPIPYTPGFPRLTTHWPLVATLYGALLLALATAALSYALNVDQTYVLTAPRGKVPPNQPLDTLYAGFALAFLELALTATPQTYDARADYTRHYALPAAADALLEHPLLAPRDITTSPVFGTPIVTPLPGAVAVNLAVVLVRTLDGQTISTPCTATLQITALLGATPSTYQLRVMAFQLTVNR